MVNTKTKTRIRNPKYATTVDPRLAELVVTYALHQVKLVLFRRKALSLKGVLRKATFSAMYTEKRAADAAWKTLQVEYGKHS